MTFINKIIFNINSIFLSVLTKKQLDKIIALKKTLESTKNSLEIIILQKMLNFTLSQK